jgi:hypothetical protein
MAQGVAVARTRKKTVDLAAALTLWEGKNAASGCLHPSRWEGKFVVGREMQPPLPPVITRRVILIRSEAKGRTYALPGQVHRSSAAKTAAQDDNLGVVVDAASSSG